MNIRLFLSSIVLCVIPAVSQYLVDTIPGINYIRSATLIGDALYLNCRDGGKAGSVSVIRNGVKTNLYPGNYSENGPMDFTLINGDVYYCFNDLSTGYYGRYFNSLWKIEGGTSCVEVVAERVGEPVAIGDTLYFRKHDTSTGYELWVYNTKTNTANIVVDIGPGQDEFFPSRLTAFNNKLYFFASHPAYGYELWTSDGSAAGTYMVKDIWPGPHESVQSYALTIGYSFDYLEPVYKFTECNGCFYFLAEDDKHGLELWRSDGTGAGTTMVKDIVQNGHAFNKNNWVTPPLFCVFNNELYFLPDYGANGRELWKTDGTEAGTYMVKDINPGPAGSDITELKVYNGYLYFDANDGVHGRELWRTDGTTNGTVMFMDLQPQMSVTNNSNPTDLTTHVDGKLYFIYKNTTVETICDDQGFCFPYATTIVSLARTDGTVAGTEKILDFPLDEDLDSTHMLTSASQGLYFKRCVYNYHKLCWLHTDEPLFFTSTPVTSALTGDEYIYNIAVTDPDGRTITIEAATLPSWMSFIDNGNGTATLRGTPSAEGDFNVILNAKTPGTVVPVMQSFTVQVRKPVVDNFLEVYFYEEQLSSIYQSNPRVYVVNTGSTAVSNFKVEYYFMVENGKTPVLEKYYTAGCSVSLVSVAGSFYKIIYDFTGVTIQPGQSLPNSSGVVIGLHYTDYSPWDKTNDYSNNLSSAFIENNRICIYSESNVLLYGTPPSGNIPPVAVAGNSFTVVDIGGDGESVSLDGSLSTDVDGSILSYDWYIDGVLAATGRTGLVTLYVGVHQVCLQVTDDDGAVSSDTIIITVLDNAHAITFDVSPDPVPFNTPVFIQYNVPASMNGATIQYKIKRNWDTLCGTLDGRQGAHVIQFWEWNKYYFGGSGPWPLTIEVNGVVLSTKQIRFAY